MKTYQKLLFFVPVALMPVIFSTGCNKEAKAANYLSAARKCDQKADYAAAEINYKNSLAAQPGNPEALKGLGLLLLRQGALLDSAGLLSEAKLKLAEDDEIGVSLGKALLSLGFVTDARKELLEVISRNPKHCDALLLLAEASLTPEAMTECEEMITKANSSDQTHVLLASALIAIRRGQSDIATVLINRAIETDSGSARAFALLGNLLRRSKQQDQALEHLKTASELAGPRSDELGFYAIHLVELDRRREAREELMNATKEAPDYLPNWRLLAGLALASGDEAEAESSLAKVLAKCPLDIEAGVLQSQLWMLRKENEKAVELLEKLNTAFPHRPNIELSLAKCYLAAGDLYKAGQLLDRVLTVVPGALEAIQLRSALYLKEGQPGEAIHLIEPVHAARAANRTVQQLLVAAYQAANRPDDAIAIVRGQSESTPDDPAVPLHLGVLLRSQGKSAEARANFERALVLNPDQIAAISQLVSLDQSEGKEEAAMSRIDAYLKDHPGSPAAHLVKAGLCYARKDFRSAEAAAARTIDLKPDDPTAYSILVRIQIADGRAEEAATRLRDLVNSRPDNRSARMYLGSLLRELGRTNEAKSEFEEIVKIDPNFAVAWNDLAYLDAGIPGRLEQAWANASKARSLQPDDPAIADTYGWIAFLRGDYRQALPILQESARGLPEVSSVQYHLAMVHSMMHQIPEAIEALNRALSAGNGFPEKQQAEAQLSILRDGDQLELSALDQLLESSPANIVVLMLKAGKLTNAGRFDDAASVFERALEINPELEVAHLGLVNLYMHSMHNSGKALDFARQARKAAPQSPRVAAVLGKITYRRGFYQEAYDLLSEAARQLPADLEVQKDYARSVYSMGRVVDARSIITKHTPILPEETADTRDFLALTEPNAAASSETAALAASKLADDPDNVPALMVRAALEEKAGENPVPTYLKVLEVFPQFTPAGIALARIYVDDPTKIGAAEELANAARKQFEDVPEISSILALVNFRKGQFDYAAQLLGELSTKRQLSGCELFALGMSMAATDHMDEARKALTQALQTDLKERDAAEARYTLAELERRDVK